MHNTMSEPKCKPWNLGDKNVLVAVCQVAMDHCGLGVDNEGGLACVGSGGTWEISIPSI